MGHWGNDFLENDEAVDWLCDLQKYIENTIDGNGPRGSKGEAAIDEKMAAIYVATTLEFKPNFNKKFGCCPLGWKFPNDQLVDSCLESIKEMKKQIENNECPYDPPPIEQLNILQDRVETIKNKLIAEHL